MADDVRALRAIAHAALLAPSPLARYRPAPPRRAAHGDIVLGSEGAGPEDNWVLVLGPAAPERVFALAAEFFGGAAGYSVALEVETAGALEQSLRDRRWRLVEEEPALVLPDPPAEPPPSPPELTIVEVADEAALAEFRGLSPGGSSMVPTLAAATDPAVALFLGRVDGRAAVASSRLTCLGPVAEIHSVNVLPTWRRRGYATALTWAAVACGVRRGCRAATLTATEMGYPVYLRMGFRPVATYRTYLPPEGAPAAP